MKLSSAVSTFDSHLNSGRPVRHFAAPPKEDRVQKNPDFIQVKFKCQRDPLSTLPVVFILISNMQGHNPGILRSKVTALLQEVPGGRIQLFKFREMFERRFHTSIGVSDLYKMKDVVTVIEEPSGR